MIAPTATRVCVGVQAVPETSCKAVEARAEQHSISVQAEPIATSTFVQTALAISTPIASPHNSQVLESPLTTPPSSTHLRMSLELLQETPGTESSGLPEAPAAPMTRSSKRKQRSKDYKNAKRRRLRAEQREALAQLEASQQEEGEWSPDADEDEKPNKVDLDAGAGNPATSRDTDQAVAVKASVGLASQESTSTLIGDGETAMDLSDVRICLLRVDRSHNSVRQDQSDGTLSPMELDSPSSSALSSPATSCFPVSLPATQASFSIGSVSPTLRSKDLPYGLLLGGPQFVQASQTSGADGDPAMLSPLTPLPSLDGSDSSPSLQGPSSGLVASRLLDSTSVESPGYTPSALVLPELPDLPPVRRDLGSTPQGPSQELAPAVDLQRLDKVVDLQETMLSTVYKCTIPTKPASQSGSRDIFVRATLVSGSSLDALPSGVTMHKPEVKGKVSSLSDSQPPFLNVSRS